MPSEERMVQEDGVLIDHINYYADVLKPYSNSLGLLVGGKGHAAPLARVQPNQLVGV
jgi:hypothetical protein